MNCFVSLYWIFFALLFAIIAYLDIRYSMLRCVTTSGSRPFSWGRVQLAWWTLIILTAFITIICCSTGNQIPALDSSTVILLGISSGTTVTAGLIDQSAREKPDIKAIIEKMKKENFFLDILSDSNGVTVHRLQTVLFNFVFGIWFINYVLQHFADPCIALHPAVADCASQPWNYIIPVVSNNNLILLGVSSATYAAMKTTENTETTSTTPATTQPSPSTTTTQTTTYSTQPQTADQSTQSIVYQAPQQQPAEQTPQASTNPPSTNP